MCKKHACILVVWEFSPALPYLNKRMCLGPWHAHELEFGAVFEPLLGLVGESKKYKDATCTQFVWPGVWRIRDTP